MKKPKAIAPRVSQNLSKALCKELGFKRVAIDLLTCVTTVYTLTGGRGLTLQDVRYLYLKYPNLLTWSDFQINKLEDLDRFVIDKEQYKEVLRIVSLGRYEEA